MTWGLLTVLIIAFIIDEQHIIYIKYNRYKSGGCAYQKEC